MSMFSGKSGSDCTGYENYPECRYPYPESITALGVDGPGNFNAIHPKVRAVQYDGRIFPFADKEFDKYAIAIKK